MFIRLLSHAVTVVIAAVLAVGTAAVGAYYIFTPQKQILSVVQAATTTLESSLTADGTVDTQNDVTLSFQTGGTVSAINVAVGDRVSAGQTLASLQESDLNAQLESAEADVSSSPAAIASNGSASLADATFFSVIQDAYLKASDAVINHSDLLFNSPTSANPQLAIPTDSSAAAAQLNEDRIAINGMLDNWKKDVGLAASSTPSEALSVETENSLSYIQEFLTALSGEASRLTAGNSGLSQSAITADISDINAAASEVNGAVSEFNAANAAWKAATGDLQKAEAGVSVIQAELGNSSVVAPFGGTVGSVVPKVGQTVSTGDPVIQLLSSGAYEIDVYVPENQTGLVSVGQNARVTFDADQGLTATGTVESIDLAPTVEDGTDSYKVTLYLDGSDPRIRSGMTANVTFAGPVAAGVLALPSSAVISSGGQSFVMIQAAPGKFVPQAVETGASAGGMTEIISGIRAGDTVAAFGSSSNQ
jgi:multidrug efflux pump subunit AcrA (membrane-fusion protein)